MLALRTCESQTRANRTWTSIGCRPRPPLDQRCCRSWPENLVYVVQLMIFGVRSHTQHDWFLLRCRQRRQIDFLTQSKNQNILRSLVAMDPENNQLNNVYGPLSEPPVLWNDRVISSVRCTTSYSSALRAAAAVRRGVSNDCGGHLARIFGKS